MKKVLSYLSISSSDSYQSLNDLDKPNAINCPICLMETNKNKILKCKHGLCKLCYKELKKQKDYKCPICRKKYKTTNINTALALSYTFNGINI